jgi:BirA family biotin operon repressor/biotin-[acetyl-CoA-carboxylase] ligase
VSLWQPQVPPHDAFAQALSMKSLPWPVESLWQQLEPLRPGLSVEVMAQADSTNTRLLERARAGENAACLLVAEDQFAGRGRHGRTWTAGPGASLTFSIGLPFAPADFSGLSLAVGVALAEALHERVMLKWPNDLWLVDSDGTGRKLGGILIETVGTQGGGRHVVVGVGLNIAPLDAPDLRNTTACLQELDPVATAPATLERVALPLLQALLRFESEGFAAFAEAFARHDLLRGRRVRTTLPEAVEGVAQGVDASGALLLHTAEGLRSITSGEVSVRPC